MRLDKDIAFELRRQGKTYNEIHTKLNVSKSTLCEWFRNEEWSKHLVYKNNRKNLILSKDRILKLNQGRSERLKKLYSEIEIEATNQFEIFKNDTLFIAGLMVYAGEGDKKNRNNTRVSNSEFYLHKIVIRFAEKYLNIDKSMIKLALLLYSDNSIEDCVNTWQKELGIPIENFHKTHIIQGKEPVKRLQYGVGISIISSRVVVKKKVLTWLELCKSLF